MLLAQGLSSYRWKLAKIGDLNDHIVINLLKKGGRYHWSEDLGLTNYILLTFDILQNFFAAFLNLCCYPEHLEDPVDKYIWYSKEILWNIYVHQYFRKW